MSRHTKKSSYKDNITVDNVNLSRGNSVRVPQSFVLSFGKYISRQQVCFVESKSLTFSFIFFASVFGMSPTSAVGDAKLTYTWLDAIDLIKQIAKLFSTSVTEVNDTSIYELLNWVTGHTKVRFLRFVHASYPTQRSVTFHVKISNEIKLFLLSAKWAYERRIMQSTIQRLLRNIYPKIKSPSIMFAFSRGWKFLQNFFLLHLKKFPIPFRRFSQSSVNFSSQL